MTETNQDSLRPLKLAIRWPRLIVFISILVILWAILVKLLIHKIPPVQPVQPLKDNSLSTHQLILDCPVKFDNVQGCDQVKEQLVQIVEFLENPEKYEKYGASMPRGYLLSGPPGVGKTFLAKAVAGEAGVPFLAISGAEFEEMYIGIGAARIRNLFVEARKFEKAVIFIDEIDAVAGKRDGMNGLDSNRRQTINQLLVEMDGFGANKKQTGTIIVLAATNSVQSLDPAILRPGRFDHTLTLTPPDIEGRRQILETLLSSIPNEKLSKDVNARVLSRITIGFTGADLANLVNRAKLIASNDDNALVISKDHFRKAKDFISFGPERKLIMTEEEKERTAYHEAGHAVVALATPGSYPVQQATIIPHANLLGLVLTSPDEDVNNISLHTLKAKIDMNLGGFIAEEIKYNPDHVSTCPMMDLKTANEVARIMVKSGFGPRTRFFQFSSEDQPSERSKEIFDMDVNDILKESEERVHNLIKKYEKAWKAIAKALLEYECLNREQLNGIFENNIPEKLNK